MISLVRVQSPKYPNIGYLPAARKYVKESPLQRCLKRFWAILVHTFRVQVGLQYCEHLGIKIMNLGAYLFEYLNPEGLVWGYLSRRV